MSTNVNVAIFLKVHEKNDSSIVDGGHLLHRVQIEHHDVCKTSQIWWKGNCVETSSFSNTTNMGLNRLYGEHSVLEVSEIMLQVFKAKNFINVHVNGELMASNPTIYFIISQNGIGIEFSNQWVTHPGEITKELFPTSILKTTWDKVVSQINQVHKSLLDDWSLLKELTVSLKVLGRAESSIVHFLPLVSTLCNGLLLWSHL